MSTKATIAYGDDFHFYREAFDDNFVYLEMERVPFEASPDRVMMPIPVHIWEVIRHYEGVDLSLADETDESIRARVESEVDRRIREVQEADGERPHSWIALSGAGIYGSAATPRDEQMDRGLKHFLERREWERQVRTAIEELQRSLRR